MIKTFINPFEIINEYKLLFFGILSILTGSLLASYFNAYFDSLLHISFVSKTAFLDLLIQNLSHSCVLTFTLFVLGKFINTKTRIIDILNIVLISRIPFYFSVLTNYNNHLNIITNKLISQTDLSNFSLSTNEYLFLMIASILALMSLIWFGILIWNGFKTATNSKSIKDIVLFIFTIILTNFISAYVLTILT